MLRIFQVISREAEIRGENFADVIKLATREMNRKLKYCCTFSAKSKSRILCQQNFYDEE